MKKQLPFELVYQVGALVISVMLVHLVYVTLIRPNADAILEQQAQLQASGQPYVQDRSLYVVLRDFEQESCFILMFWAVAIMGFKGRNALNERKLLNEDLIQLGDGMSILPQDTREFTRPLQALPEDQQETLLPRSLLAALHRFASTRNVQDASEAVKSVCEGESDRLDSELSMIRYIAWAIPSIGFIGTVRGIGEALGQAYRAVEGDIAGVTTSLGVAFNSTFIALVISIVLMFLMHQLQLIQERLVLDTHSYCDQRLLRHLQVRQD
ncbi:MAG: biopolymer transport protein ExbB/TolQ [Limisphaerales bacterium]|jgi:biopolymer transport protein ExbB/TolQ